MFSKHKKKQYIYAYIYIYPDALRAVPPPRFVETDVGINACAVHRMPESYGKTHVRFTIWDLQREGRGSMGGLGPPQGLQAFPGRGLGVSRGASGELPKM